MPPQVFIASSTENLEVVHAIRDGLRDSDIAAVSPVPWDEGTFEPSQTIIASIEKALDRCDYAILVLTPDDFIRSRKKKYKAPRDNALLELGLFMGRRGRDHCYIVHVESEGRKRKFKMPSDLGGVLTLTYSDGSEEQLRETIGTACDTILKTIRKRERDKARTFTGRIAGGWWELITVGDVRELSYFTILADGSGTALSMNGDHYRYDPVENKIDRIGRWNSSAVGIDRNSPRLLYCWTGTHPRAVEDDAARVEGYGWMEFDRSLEPSGPFTEGSGEFMDLDPNQPATAKWKDIRLIRATADEVVCMTEEPEAARLAQAAKILETPGR